MTIIQDAMFTQFPDPNYDPRADLNGDGRIRGDDMIIWGMWTHRGPLDHNVAVVNITFSYDTIVVYPTWNETLEIYVKVKNKGSAYNESFTVTVYNGTTPIGTQDITDLEPGSEQTKNFSWTIPTWAEYPDNRTSAWPYPNHTIKANATLANDVHLDDNVY